MHKADIIIMENGDYILKVQSVAGEDIYMQMDESQCLQLHKAFLVAVKASKKVDDSPDVSLN